MIVFFVCFIPTGIRSKSQIRSFPVMVRCSNVSRNRKYISRLILLEEDYDTGNCSKVRHPGTIVKLLVVIYRYAPICELRKQEREAGTQLVLGKNACLLYRVNFYKTKNRII